MSETDNLCLPFIEAGQAQKHITHNEALQLLDTVVQLAVGSVTSTPPGSPVAGERRIVGASPTGAFAGHANAVAAYQNGAWAFATPKPGWRAWNIAEEALLVWGGTAWVEFVAGEGGGGGGEFDPENVEFLYINGADPEGDATKLAVYSNDVLFDAVRAADSGTGDVRLQLCKAAAGDTASIFFSKDFEGRAEFGLVGSDEFKLKVSSNGTDYREVLVIDPATGAFLSGARVSSKNHGTVSSGTVTPDPFERTLHHYVNGGAHTLAPSTNMGFYALDIENNGSAGAITVSGWNFVTGDAFTTTNAHKFRCHVTIGEEGSTLEILALQ